MVQIYTAEEVAKLAEGTDPYLKGLRNLEDACKFDIVELLGAAMPQQTQFFNRSAIPGITNMEKPNQTNFPLWITGIGVAIWGTLADAAIVHGHTQVVLEKDARRYTAFPTNNLPSGGGLKMAIDDATAATTNAFATHGLDSSFFVLPTPIAYAPDQIIRVILESDATVLVAATGVGIFLRGVEARTVR